jgi:hypothetical protein
MLSRRPRDERICQPSRVDKSLSVREKVCLQVEVEAVGKSNRPARAGDCNNPDYETGEGQGRQARPESVSNE